MRLGGEMHEGVDALFLQQLADEIGVADVAVHETERGIGRATASRLAALPA